MVVILRFFEGLSFQQMAERLQENINTIKSRLYRALQKLRIFIEEPKVIL
jgi:RNA polymerase sigma-70 factor (ECF subfamily)